MGDKGAAQPDGRSGEGRGLMGVMLTFKWQGLPPVKMALENLSPNVYRNQLFGMLGQIIIRSSMRTFAAEGRPARWAPLKWTTIRRRLLARAGRRKTKGPRGSILLQRGGTMMRGVRILQDEGIMKASVGQPGVGDATGRGVYRITGDLLEIGTGLPRGRTHQFGDPRRNIPRRPFLTQLPEDDQAMHKAVEFVIQHARGVA